MKTLLLSVCICSCFWLNTAHALTRVTPVANSQIQISTGYFGGIFKNSTFRLIRSAQGGIIYYRITMPFTVTYRQTAISITDLPLNTPVTLTTDSGRVVSIEIGGSGL